MNQVEIFDLRNYMRSRMAEQSLFNRAVSLSLGIAIAKVLDDDLETQARRFAIDALIDSFNEHIVVDIEVTRQVAISLLKIRKAIDDFGPRSLSLPKLPGTFLERFFAVQLDLSQEDLKFLNDNAETILVFSNRIQNLLNTDIEQKKERAEYSNRR